MEVEGDFAKLQIDQFLKRTSIKSLSTVDAIYLICNPKNHKMPRHICIKSKGPIDGWNYNWIPIKPDDSPFDRLLNENDTQEKLVQQYYQANEHQFRDVKTLEGQMRLEDATGVRGGSFIFNPKRSSEASLKDLIRAFLVLARAINRGYFNVDTMFTLSLKINAKASWSRIKLDMSDSLYLVDALKNIQRAFRCGRCSHFYLKYKTHVASYLSQLSEFENRRSFHAPLRTTTELIDVMLQKLETIFQPPSPDLPVSTFSQSYQFCLFMFLFNLVRLLC